MKLAPQSLRSLARAPKIEMWPWYRNLVTVLTVWLGVTYTIMCFMKWSWNIRTWVTLGGLFSSRVVSMLVKSTCKRSMRVVATIRCWGTLDKLPSCCKQCVQDLMDCCIWLAMPGHLKCSCSKDKVWLWPWWPASLWHPFKVVTWWALGAMKSRKSPVSPLCIECKYKAPWWIVKFCWFHKTSWPSSLEVCSARSTFKSVCFCAFSKSNTVLNSGSSLWAFSPVFNMHFYRCAACMATHTSCSKCWSAFTMNWVIDFSTMCSS